MHFATVDPWLQCVLAFSESTLVFADCWAVLVPLRWPLFVVVFHATPYLVPPSLPFPPPSLSFLPPSLPPSLALAHWQ